MSDTREISDISTSTKSYKHFSTETAGRQTGQYCVVEKVMQIFKLLVILELCLDYT